MVKKDMGEFVCGVCVCVCVCVCVRARVVVCFLTIRSARVEEREGGGGE
jgi:hypothetical protein